MNPIFRALTRSGNAIIAPLVRRGRFPGSFTIVTYVGRRSGKTFSTPVGYRRTADGVRILVALPDQKTWWRNFDGDGGEITLLLDGRETTGHAVAARDGRVVRVDVALA